MEEIKTGGHAFPTNLGAFDEHGMTLRDYFAAKAMQQAYYAYVIEKAIALDWTKEGIAEAAYAMADAMLARR